MTRTTEHLVGMKMLLTHESPVYRGPLITQVGGAYCLMVVPNRALLSPTNTEHSFTSWPTAGVSMAHDWWMVR